MADIGKRFPVLRGLGPECEAGGGYFHGRKISDWALGVMRPAFRGAGCTRRSLGSQFCANTSSWS